ncbi:outer membrane lipoprotein carrier protein LolA [Hirschia baltica]|uniref:Uncharacterized protein n=1 Tax=Hirschia baltica (strain ATCC 49814 / DSM 5838 / IFAM 1418) TaxID=582402 RepID=C6XIP2_HIRBI|nr:outer membrane lipoprotein carrier protein LolA [Hirschia baltica]ACT58987.1 hypothetical protein Hbal_1295 [Hirschia baltica ATCC 49814]
MTSLIIGFAFLLAAQSEPAAADNQCLAPQSVAQEIGSRKFTQERRLEGIEQSLVSQGIVNVSADAIEWTVLDPIEITTVISPNGMTQSIEGGPAQEVGAVGASNPILSQSGLIQLLKGDLTGADANYTVTDFEINDGWGVSLAPKAEDMAKHVTKIDVTGCMKIDSINVVQANGDQILVKFAEE